MRTGHKPQPPRSVLASSIPPTNDAERTKRNGWIKHGLLAVSIDDPRLGWLDKQVIKELGTRLYGKRHTG